MATYTKPKWAIGDYNRYGSTKLYDTHLLVSFKIKKHIMINIVTVIIKQLLKMNELQSLYFC